MSHLQNDNYYESINEYAQEYQAEQLENLRPNRLHIQLQNVWLKMVKDYTHIYTMQDYYHACNQSKILIF